MKIKALYFDKEDIYLLNEDNDLYLIARLEKLSKRKKKEIVNDCVVPDEFYDDFQGTLEDAIYWLEEHRKEMIENFDEWMLEYLDFDYRLHDGNTMIVGQLIGKGGLSKYDGSREWETLQTVKSAIRNAGKKLSDVKTILYYYKTL